MKKMFNTKQEVIDHIADWFLVQKNPPGYDFENRCCVYGTTDPNIACGIGCLIPYEERIEMQCADGIGSAFTLNPLTKLLHPLQRHLGKEAFSEKFLRDIQQVHDASAGYGVSDFHRMFARDLHRLVDEIGLTWREEWDAA